MEKARWSTAMVSSKIVKELEIPNNILLFSPMFLIAERLLFYFDSFW